MNSPSDTSPYEVVEMQRSQRTGPGARILFGLILKSPIPPPQPDTSPSHPIPLFCLCYKKGCWGNRDGWELNIDGHYNPVAINAVASNGAHMGLGDLIKLARTYAQTTYPNG